MTSEEEREEIRRMHSDDPITATNVYARMGHSQAMRGDYPQAQVYATLAVAQEVKNLRLAMYPQQSTEETL